MEELQPQELEGLVQELQGESGAQESLPEEVEELLRGLQSPSRYPARKVAAEQLGKVGTSGAQIMRALIAAYESDSRLLGVRQTHGGKVGWVSELVPCMVEGRSHV